MIRCGVCGRGLGPVGNHGWQDEEGRRHPIHTDAELAETREAVDSIVRVLAAQVLTWFAGKALAS